MFRLEWLEHVIGMALAVTILAAILGVAALGAATFLIVQGGTKHFCQKWSWEREKLGLDK